MTEKEYKRYIKEAKRAANQIISKLIKGQVDGLHYVIPDKQKQLILNELAALREFKSLEVKFVGERGAAKEVDFEVQVETKDKVCTVELTIYRTLQNLRWTYLAGRPHMVCKSKQKTKSVTNSNTDDKQSKTNRKSSQKKTSTTKTATRKRNK